MGFRKTAVRAGIGIGVIADACYLYANHSLKGISGGMSPPDPVWTQFVNVALISFAVIYAANLLGKGLERLLPAGRSGEKPERRDGASS